MMIHVFALLLAFKRFHFKEAHGKEMIQGKVKPMTSYTRLLFSSGLFEYLLLQCEVLTFYFIIVMSLICRHYLF